MRADEITFRVEPEVKERLIAAAARDERTLSGTIRHAINEYLEKGEK